MADLITFPGAQPYTDTVDEARVMMLAAIDKIRDRVESGMVRAFVYAEIDQQGGAAYLPGCGEAGDLELRGLIGYLQDFHSLASKDD